MLSLSPPEPALLTRVTTQYDQDQDRIRLAGETTAGQVQQLWLTQRLLLRLLPGLWQWLQQLPQDGVAADAIAASATADPQRHQALQEFAQQQASASLQRLEPVVDAGLNPPWLVRSAQVQSSHQLLKLQLFSASDVDKASEPGNRTAVISMNPTQLRQWLGILHQELCRGEWPTTQWPQWISPAQPAPASAQIH